MRRRPPVLLTIAGFDPSSGAGVTADLKTLAAHGCYGVAAITALTVQSTAGVRGVAPLAGQLVRQTLDELAADFRLAGVRIGMLGSAEVARVVAGFLRRQKRRLPVVLDPILRSSSGAELLERRGIAELRRLLPLATVVTPNLDEAAALTGLAVRSREQMRAAACRLHELGARNVVITGGHLRRPVDLLSMGGGTQQIEFAGRRVARRRTHGTGCALATALAANLALGYALPEAVGRAHGYVAAALRGAFLLGRGARPLAHLALRAGARRAR